MLKLADTQILKSAHDCSDGGLAIAIAECCFLSLGRNAIGAEIDLKAKNLSRETLLFGETPSRIVISFGPDDRDRIQTMVDDCPFEIIGRVRGTALTIKMDDSILISSPIRKLESAWKNSLADQLEPVRNK